MLGGLFTSGPKFDVNKCKVQLKCLVTRLDQRAAKKSNIAKQEKRKVAMLLKDDKAHNAQILCEQIIRDDYVLESYEMIKQYAEMLSARINVLQLEPELKPEIADSVCALVYSGYCMGGEIEELKHLFNLFTAKYGKAFTERVVAEKEKFLNDRFLKILISTSTPDKTVVEAYLTEIAKMYDVAYEPQVGSAQPVSATLGIALPTPGMPMPGTQVPAPINPISMGMGVPGPPAAMSDLTDLSGVVEPPAAAAPPPTVPGLAVAPPNAAPLPMGVAAPENAYSLVLSKAATATKEGGLLRSGFGLLVDYTTCVVVETELSNGVSTTFSRPPGVSVEALRSVAIGDRVVAFNGHQLDENTTLKSLAADVDLGGTATFQFVRGGGNLRGIATAPPPSAVPSALPLDGGVPTAQQQPTVIGGPPPAPRGGDGGGGDGGGGGDDPTTSSRGGWPPPRAQRLRVHQHGSGDEAGMMGNVHGKHTW